MRISDSFSCHFVNFQEPQRKGPKIVNESLDQEDKRGTDNTVDQQNEGVS